MDENSNHKSALDPPRQKLPAEVGSNLPISSNGFGGVIMPSSMRDVLDFADLMARSGAALPRDFRNNKGMCMAVIMQAVRWGLDPYAVANKSYVVNDRLAYEAQLIAAVINVRAPLKSRLSLEYTGKGQDMAVKVCGVLRGETEIRVVKTPPVKDIKGKSPLWISDPAQQLAYYGSRAWARRYCPEIIMGVYDRDELIDMEPSESGAYVPAEQPVRQEAKVIEQEPSSPFFDDVVVDSGEPADESEDLSADDDVAEDDDTGTMISAQDRVEDYLAQISACTTAEDIADVQANIDTDDNLDMDMQGELYCAIASKLADFDGPEPEPESDPKQPQFENV